MSAPRLCFVALLIFLTLAVYWPVRDQGFVWDDRIHIYDNPYLNPVTPANVRYFWQKPFQGLYIPLTYTVWAAIAGWGQMDGAGFDPRPFHLANLILHALNVLLVFAILRLLARNDWAAFCGALLFAMHPVQLEPVAWVSGMKDLLSGFLSLVAIVEYLAYAKSVAAKDQSAKRDELIFGEVKSWQPSLHYAAATLAYALALISKPTAIVVPLILWILDYWILKRPWRRSATALVGWLILAVPFIALTKLSQSDATIKFVTPLWGRPLVAGDALTFYLYKLAVPLWLSPDYGRTPEWVLQQGWIYLTWLAPLALALALWRLSYRRPWLAASAGIFVAGVLPVLGFVPFAFQYVSTVADRFLYLSMLGPALALAGLLEQCRRGLIAVICVGIVGLLGVKSTLQARVWSDSESLWTHALAVNPHSSSVHFNLAFVRQMRGDGQGALAHYRRSIELAPDFADAHYNLGNLLSERGQSEQALEHYRRAIKIAPNYWDAHNNLGVELERHGELAEAIQHYRRAWEINPGFTAGRQNLAMALAKQGKLDEAIEHFKKILEISAPSSQTHFSLGVALTRQARLDEAINHFQQALAIKPDFAEAYHYLGKVRAAKGDLAKAVDEFRKALQIRPEFAAAHESLGRALAQQGRRDEAVQHYQEALRLMKSGGGRAGR